MYVWVHACCGMHGDVREQPVESVAPSCHVGPGDWAQGVRHLSSMSRLPSSPNSLVMCISLNSSIFWPWPTCNRLSFFFAFMKAIWCCPWIWPSPVEKSFFLRERRVSSSSPSSTPLSPQTILLVTGPQHHLIIFPFWTSRAPILCLLVFIASDYYPRPKVILSLLLLAR